MKRHSPFPESQPKRPRTPQSPRNDSVYPAPSPSLLHIETRGAAPGFEGFGDLVDAEITGFEDDDDEDEQRALDCSIGQPEAIGVAP